jgi:predicted DNA binding protein
MIEATLAVNMGDSWIRDILLKHKVTIKFLGWLPDSSDGKAGKSLIEIRGNEKEIKSIPDALKDNPFICKLQISKVGKASILGAIEVNDCAICKAVQGTDCFLTHGVTTEDGALLLKIVAGERKSVRDFIFRLEEDGCKVKIVSLRDPEKEEILTERQEEILRTAYELGYFEYPKKVSIKELAEKLNMSISTLSEMLRKSEKRVLEYYFSDK